MPSKSKSKKDKKDKQHLPVMKKGIATQYSRESPINHKPARKSILKFASPPGSPDSMGQGYPTPGRDGDFDDFYFDRRSPSGTPPPSKKARASYKKKSKRRSNKRRSNKRRSKRRSNKRRSKRRSNKRRSKRGKMDVDYGFDE